MNNINSIIEAIYTQHPKELSSTEQELLKKMNYQALKNLSQVNTTCSGWAKKIIGYMRVDLKEHTVLQRCFSKASLKEASAILNTCYEAPLRAIKDRRYGAAFPVPSELLHYAMFLAKGETVLEIAGARGENAAL